MSLRERWTPVCFLGASLKRLILDVWVPFHEAAIFLLFFFTLFFCSWWPFFDWVQAISSTCCSLHIKNANAKLLSKLFNYFPQILISTCLNTESCVKLNTANTFLVECSDFYHLSNLWEGSKSCILGWKAL